MSSNLFILFCISSVGFIVYFWRNIPKTILHLMLALGAGTMLSVALVHILPESLKENSLAMYAFLGGFLMIYIIEELLTPLHHIHVHGDHTHEDPLEHLNHVIIVSWLAIFLHTLFDGVGIRAGQDVSTELGNAIFVGVAIHQIPVSLGLASLLKQSHFKKNVQVILMLTFALAAPLGYVLTQVFLVGETVAVVGLLAAFAGGSLLYVSNVEFLPMIHAQTTQKMKYLSLILFLIGTIGMSLVKLWE